LFEVKQNLFDLFSEILGTGRLIQATTPSKTDWLGLTASRDLGKLGSSNRPQKSAGPLAGRSLRVFV
jgi:hypothetical protein